MTPISTIIFFSSLLVLQMLNGSPISVGNNWVTVQTEKDLSIAKQGLSRAQSQYSKHFGTPPENGLIIDINTIKEEEGFGLENYDWHLAWPFDGPQQNQAMQAMEAQFRQQIKEQLIQSGQDASAASIEKILAKFRKSLNLNNSATQGLSLTTPSIIAHEIGHQFFIHGIWSSYAVESETQYGSTAPDWLDEAAAILMEDEAHTTSRRDIFRSALQTQAVFSPSALFKAIHPQAKSQMLLEAKANARNNANGVSISIQPSGDGDHSLFYAKVRVFLDYLASRTTNATYMRSISLHLKSNGTMESWLEAYGSDFGLPDTLSMLDRDFKKFITEVYINKPHRDMDDGR